MGRTIAEWLAREGADVIVSGREADAVDASVQALKALGSDAFGIPADLANLDDTDRLAAAALAHAPQLDILVNNAGMSIRSSFWEVTPQEFEYQLNVNWRSPFVLNQTIAKNMIDRGIQGRIVNISTIGARACHKDALVYDAAKGAVEVRPEFVTVQFLVRRREVGGLVVLLVRGVGPADVLQPVLAPVGDDAEHPGVEPAAHFGEVVVRLDERHLEDVFRNVRTSRHAEGMPVERVTVTLDQDTKGVAVAREDLGDDLLVDLELVYRRVRCRVFHGPSITAFCGSR